MKVASLFSGVGGFDLAFERAGADIIWQSENDLYASQVLARHWPFVPNLGDINDIIYPPFPGPDLLVGGFPCQDYSKAGRGAGLAGDRGALWWQYHRLIAECKPTWVVGENVDTLLTSNGGRDFETIIGSVTDLGYGVVWATLDSQHFGVPQRRRRIFFVGHSGGEPRPEVLALSEGLFGDPRPSRTPGEDIAGALTTRLGTSGADTADAEAGWLMPEVLGTLRERDWRGPPIDIEEPSLVVVNSAQTPIVSDQLQPLDQNSRASQAIAFVENQRNEVRELGDQLGALQSSPGQKQQPYLAEVTGVRRITPLEAERAQGFPDDWTAGCSNMQRYRQMGNAVTVPVAEWIATRILKEA